MFPLLLTPPNMVHVDHVWTITFPNVPLVIFPSKMVQLDHIAWSTWTSPCASKKPIEIELIFNKKTVPWNVSHLVYIKSPPMNFLKTRDLQTRKAIELSFGFVVLSNVEVWRPRGPWCQHTLDYPGSKNSAYLNDPSSNVGTISPSK
jgi:hypothetical protein